MVKRLSSERLDRMTCADKLTNISTCNSGFADLLVKVEATGAARRAQTDIQRKLTALSKQPNNSERVVTT